MCVFVVSAAKSSRTPVHKTSTEEILSLSVSNPDFRSSVLAHSHSGRGEEEPKPSPSAAYQTFVTTLREAADVPSEVGKEAEETQRELTGSFTPEQRRVFVATLLRDHKEFVIYVTSHIFLEERLFDEGGHLDRDVVNEVKKIIVGLDDQEFAPDVKAMILDVAMYLMKKHAKFATRIVERVCQELFVHMDTDTQTELMSPDGKLDEKTVIKVVEAYNKFLQRNGHIAVKHHLVHRSPIITIHLAYKYGKKYKHIIKRLAMEGKLATVQSTPNPAPELVGGGIASKSAAKSKTKTNQNLELIGGEAASKSASVAASKSAAESSMSKAGTSASGASAAKT